MKSLYYKGQTFNNSVITTKGGSFIQLCTILKFPPKILKYEKDNSFQRILKYNYYIFFIGIITLYEKIKFISINSLYFIILNVWFLKENAFYMMFREEILSCCVWFRKKKNKNSKSCAYRHNYTLNYSSFCLSIIFGITFERSFSLSLRK